jgi:hypothetical protein
MRPTIAIRPKIEPITKPAMAPGVTPSAFPAIVEELLGAVEGKRALERFELSEEGDGAAHPSFGTFGANPSIGCAKACATEVVATKGARFVEPLSSYCRTVTVDETVKSL